MFKSVVEVVLVVLELYVWILLDCGEEVMVYGVRV